MRRIFKDNRRQRVYEAAREMHETLATESSGRGMAYRRGWNLLPWPKHWASYPVYAAGRDNRRAANGAKDLPPTYDLESGARA